MREYLAGLDAAASQMAGRASAEERPERIAGEPATAKSLSLTDTASAWTSKGIRKVSFAYAVNTLVDLKRALVVDVAATPARRTAEVATTSVMIERTQRHFGLTPSRLAGHAACGTGLVTSKHIVAGGLRQCRAHPTSCGPCALKPRCTTSPARMVIRQESMRMSASTSVNSPTRRRSRTRPASGAASRCRSLTSRGTYASGGCACEAHGRQRRAPPRRDSPEPA